MWTKSVNSGQYPWPHIGPIALYPQKVGDIGQCGPKLTITATDIGLASDQCEDFLQNKDQKLFRISSCSKTSLPCLSPLFVLYFWRLKCHVRWAELEKQTTVLEVVEDLTTQRWFTDTTKQNQSKIEVDYTKRGSTTTFKSKNHDSLVIMVPSFILCADWLEINYKLTLSSAEARKSEAADLQ